MRRYLGVDIDALPYDEAASLVQEAARMQAQEVDTMAAAVVTAWNRIHG